jgi:hypothetical protein
MTTLLLSHGRPAVRRRSAGWPDGWVTRVPGGILAALRATLIYGEAERLCPPPRTPAGDVLLGRVLP